MRITFLGNFQVDYSSETHHKKTLEALGHEVICIQENEATTEHVFIEASKSDMFIWVHTHGWQTLSITRSQTMQDVLLLLKRLNIPTVTYHLDLWFGLHRQKDLEIDPIYKNIEYFFTCDKKMADWFNAETNVKGVYLPAGVFQDEMTPRLDVPRTRDVIFAGSKGYHPEWPYRPHLIQWLRGNYGSRFTHVGGDGDTGTVRGQALNDMYNSSKVIIGDSLVINFDYPHYWSDRLYETIGRGGFIIFPYIEGIENQFEIGEIGKIPAADNVELVTYEFNNFGQLKELIDYYLTHDEEREAIQKRGYERCKEYTYMKRWQEIIEKVGLGEKA